MSDEILFGNLLGLLKRGKWNLTGEEALALSLIFQEVERRLKPLAAQVKEDPIKVQTKSVDFGAGLG